MAQSNKKEYDCLLIYNVESFGTGGDNSLFVSCVTFVDEMLKNHGLITFHHDRDSLAGTSIVRELARVVETSQVVLLILDRYFLENSWMNFCKEVTLVHLIDESSSPTCPGSNRLIPIIINLAENDIPIEIKAFARIHVMNESDIKNERKWLKLKRALESHFKDKLHPPAPMQQNHQIYPETQDILAVPSETRFSPVGNGKHRHQERHSRTREHGNQPITQTPSSSGMQGTTNINIKTKMFEPSLLNLEPLVTEPETTFRSTDLEIDGQQSMQPVEATAVQRSTGHSHDHISSRSSTFTVSDSGIEQSTHGGGLRQQESLDTLAASLNESTFSTSRRSLNRPIVAVQPYTSENTNADNDQRTSVETMYFSNTLPDNIDSLR